MPPAEAPDPLHGRVIAGRYRVVRTLAAGGMGAVYVAVQESLQREVALKIVRPDRVDDGFRRRFEAEALTTSALRDPHVVSVFDFGIDGDLPYLVMEKLEGRDLADLIATAGPLPWPRAVGILRDVAAALVAAEARGVLHRDLKPSNVFLVDNAAGGDFVKVLDFGIAKLMGVADVARPRTDTSAVVGTAGYMAPERMMGGADDPRSDLYALGLIAWDMLVGASPFGTGELLQLAMRHLQEPAPRLTTRIEVPAALDDLVLQLLAKTAAERPHARDVVAALDAMIATPPPSSMAPVPPAGPSPKTETMSSPALSNKTETMAAPAPTRRRPRGLAVAGGIAVVVTLVVVAAVTRRPGAPVSASSPAVRRLTFESGVERDPALSPDGRFVVFAAPGVGGGADLFALELTAEGAAAGAAVNLTQTADALESAPAFSPDGTQLAWGVHDDEGDSVWLGGPRGERPRRLVRGAVTPSFSADGRTLAIATAGFDEPERVSTSASGAAIEIVEISTGARRVVASTSASFQPAMSARGRVAFWAVDTAGHRDLWTVDVNDGEIAAPVAVTADAAVDFQPQWSADGRTLHFLSDRGGAMGLWSVAIDDDGHPASAPVPFFTGGLAMRSAAIAADRVVYRTGASVTRVDRRALDATALTLGPAALVWETPRELTSLDASPSGAWLVAEAVAEHSDLLLISADGTQQRPLTHDSALDRSPRFVDDDTIVFASTRGGRWGVWTIRVDGTSLTALPPGPCPAVAPLPSPTGAVVAFQLECGGTLAAYPSLSSTEAPRSVALAPGPAILPMAWRGTSVVVNRPGERYDVVDLESGAVVGHPIALGAFVGLDAARLLAFQDRALVVVEGDAVAPLQEATTGGQLAPVVLAADVETPAFTLAADRRAVFISGRRDQSDLWVATLQR